MVSVVHLEKTLSSPSCKIDQAKEGFLSITSDAPTLPECSITILAEDDGSPWATVMISSTGSAGIYRTALKIPRSCLPRTGWLSERSAMHHARILTAALRRLTSRIVVRKDLASASEDLATEVASLLMANGASADDEIGVFHPTLPGFPMQILYVRGDDGTTIRLEAPSALPPLTVAAAGPLGHPIIMAGCATVLCGSVPPAEVIRRVRKPDALALWIHERLTRRE